MLPEQTENCGRRFHYTHRLVDVVCNIVAILQCSRNRTETNENQEHRTILETKERMKITSGIIWQTECMRCERDRIHNNNINNEKKTVQTTKL